MFKKDDFTSKVIRDCESSVKMYKKQIIKITNENILKDKEIQRLNNIIEKINKYIEPAFEVEYDQIHKKINENQCKRYDNFLEGLKKILKEGKND